MAMRQMISVALFASVLVLAVSGYSYGGGRRFYGSNFGSIGGGFSGGVVGGGLIGGGFSGGYGGYGAGEIRDI